MKKPNHRGGPGEVVIGVMLIVIGVAFVLERTNILQWGARFTLWPVVLVGVGLARLLQTPAGAPRQGLLLLVAGAWLFAGEAGWIALHDTWAWLVIALGLVVALNGAIRTRRVLPEQPLDSDVTGTERPGKRARPPRVRGLTGLAVLGIWIAVILAARTSGLGILLPFNGQSDVNVASVMGRSEYVSPATEFRSASMTTIMGRTELDLRNARIPPGGEAVVEVIGVMGTPVIRVPRDWAVDVSAVPVMGRISDQRFTAAEAEAGAAGPPSRLVIRGVMIMGTVIIES